MNKLIKTMRHAHCQHKCITIAVLYVIQNFIFVCIIIRIES